jgi:5'-methylthioadenosine phosphorylase
MKKIMKTKTAFITGTGFYSLPNMESRGVKSIKTPYGDVLYENAKFNSIEVTFIARHGKDHHLSPAQINYKANIYALYQLGIKRIFATSVCGSIKRNWPPGTLVILDQFLNFTYGRSDSFYPLNGKLAHVNVTKPYCPTLQKRFIESAKRLGIKIFPRATYTCTNGPRFETSAEIEMFRRLGGDIVGQTNYPECVLARELSMCYTSIGVVSNFAAGIKSSELSAKEVTENLYQCKEKIEKIFFDTIVHNPEPEECTCHHSLDHAFL